ncbi:MAG: helix-turn-helix domain-containing protein [Clostridia bacterium]|nr:helix-turn-helix domain-containing protein [Clostridia bacterium]
MAKILGVDRSYITHIVKGDRRPSVEMAKRIGALLGFDWRIFYEDQISA